MDDYDQRIVVVGHVGYWAMAVAVQSERILDRAHGDVINQLDASSLP